MTFDSPLASELAGYRGLFPATRYYAYLLSAAVSPPPEPVVRAIEECLRNSSIEGAMAFGRWMQTMERCRERLGRLLGCPPSEIAFTKNTTQGLQLAANSIPWREGDNVILNDLEFPANVFPWHEQARRRGVEVRTIPSREGRVPLEDLAAAVDDRTRAIAISWVQYSNGFRCDVEAISAYCEARGIYLVLDLVQGVGALELDLSTLGRRTLAAGGCHKWLLCPPGIGYFRCPAQLLDDLTHTNWGWLSMRDPLHLTHDVRLRPDAGRFEEGNPNMLGIHALDASLELIDRVGIRRIEQHVLGLSAYLAEGLLARGCRILSPWNGRERSAILLFAHPSLPAEVVCRSLARQGVVTIEREGGVRASPHFFNSVEDMDRLLAALPDQA